MNTTANTSKLMYSTPEAMLQDLARGGNIRAVIPTQLPRVNRRLTWPTAANRPLIVVGAVAILIGLVKPAWLGYVIGGVVAIVCVIFIGIFALGFIGSFLTVLLGLLSLPLVWLKGIRNRPNAVLFTDSDLIVVTGVHFQKHAQKHSFDHMHRLPIDTIQSCRRTPNDLTISAGDHDVTIAGVPGFVSGTAKTNVPDTRYYTDKVVPFDQFESLVSPDSSQDKGVLVTTTTFRHRSLNGDQAPSAAIGGEANAARQATSGAPIDSASLDSRPLHKAPDPSSKDDVVYATLRSKSEEELQWIEKANSSPQVAAAIARIRAGRNGT